MAAYKKFLLENEQKKSKAKAEGLTLNGFNHAFDSKGDNYEWDEEKKSWDKVIDSTTKEQILKRMKTLGFEHSSFKQLKKDRVNLKDRGFVARKAPATGASMEKLKTLPEKGRKYIINRAGSSYAIIAWGYGNAVEPSKE